jgi:hypothetical protein
MKVTVLSIFLFISAVLMTNVSARDWKVGENGLVRWDTNCHYSNNNQIGNKPSTGEQCGGVCIANNKCTHFAYGFGTCYMFANPGGESAADGSWTCGFVMARI